MPCLCKVLLRNFALDTTKSGQPGDIQADLDSNISSNVPIYLSLQELDSHHLCLVLRQDRKINTG